jgi:hypothetical protein
MRSKCIFYAEHLSLATILILDSVDIPSVNYCINRYILNSMILFSDYKSISKVADKLS